MQGVRGLLCLRRTGLGPSIMAEVCASRVRAIHGHQYHPAQIKASFSSGSSSMRLCTSRPCRFDRSCSR